MSTKIFSKQFIKISILLLIICFSFSCSRILLPYDDEPYCRLGDTGGMCGSLSSVYDKTKNRGGIQQ